MYIGGGLQIAATHTGDYVRIQPMGSNPIGAARPAEPRRPTERARQAAGGEPCCMDRATDAPGRAARTCPATDCSGRRRARGLLAWEWAHERLVASHDYWLATVRPDAPAAPHAGVGRLGRRVAVVQQRERVAEGHQPARRSRAARSRPTTRTSQWCSRATRSWSTDRGPARARARPREPQVRHRLRSRDDRPGAQHVVRAPADVGIRPRRRRLHRHAHSLVVRTGDGRNDERAPTARSHVLGSRRGVDRAARGPQRRRVTAEHRERVAREPRDDARRRAGDGRDRRRRVRPAGVLLRTHAARRQRRPAAGARPSVRTDPPRAIDDALAPPDRRGGHHHLRAARGRTGPPEPVARARRAHHAARRGDPAQRALRMGIHARARTARRRRRPHTGHGSRPTCARATR